MDKFKETILDKQLAASTEKEGAKILTEYYAPTKEDKNKIIEKAVNYVGDDSIDAILFNYFLSDFKGHP